MISRPRRSVLFMPGDNPRAQKKASGLAADVIILDLEDAVAPANKETARDQVLSTLRQHPFGRREVIVRVNRLDSHWGSDDLAALSRTNPDGILLPKVESADELFQAAVAFTAQGAPADLSLWAMVETPRGIQNIEDIACASRQLACLVLGTGDLASGLRLRESDPDRTGLIYALSRCVLAARASGLDVIDGVFFDLADSSGFKVSCEQGRRLGFDGKSLIHPSQIDPANRVFSPGSDAIDHARRVVEAWDTAATHERGVLVVDNQLVEALHVRDARRLLALHDAIEALNTGS